MSAVGSIPKELDWVATRVACSVAQVFNELRLGIENDVSEYNKKAQASDENEVSVIPTANGMGIVISRAKKIPSKRVFVGVSGNRIEIYEDTMRPKMSVGVALNDEGRCTLRLADTEADTELEQWQFRKRALEDLLFGS